MSNLIDIEYLFKEHYKKLHRIAQKVVNDPVIAEDIVQEVFIHIWNNRESLQINSTIEGYLMKSVVNRSINHLEKNKKMVKTSLSDQTELKEAMSNSKQEHFDYELFQEMVYRSLDKLPPKCKVIFMLSRFEDMKYKEIAEHLDISIKTVENQMGIAIAKLNSELKPKLKNYFPDLFFSFFIIFLQIA